MKMDRSLDKPGTSGIGASTQQGPEKFTVKGNEHDGGEREEIVKLWRQIDEKLEHKARNHNLSVVNVKTILHHLIKNPGVISLIMGIDDNASLPDLKLTRSKVKQLCKRNEAKSDVAPHTTEVVVIPRAERTFLDVDYEHNEEYDEDYNPDLDEAEVASEADGDMEVDDTDANPEDTNASLQVVEEGENDQPALHTRSRNHVVDDCLEDEPLCGDDVLLFSAIDDPDYVDFISTLNDPSRYEVDEMEDPEYNFMRDLECEETPERDELRMDRATEIPMREVENLLQDLIDSGRMNGSEQTSYSAESAKDCKERKSRKHAKREASRHAWVPQYTDHITVLMGATPDDVDKISLDSAILDGTSIEKPPKFTSSELEQLRIQLKKHVQLLTQFVVGCHFEPSLFDERNECQKMINELHELSASQPSNSVFSIKNLEASIVTCHDAINCERVEFPEVNDPRYKKMNLPLPQTMLVLARSNALLYPELLPTVRLRSFPSFYQYFTAPEESLLAMGQYMFSHIPHSTASKRDGRNALIVRYFLPNKETSQIRLHMKNFRFSPEPIYEIITRAEQGKVTMIFPVEKSDSEQSTPPYMWHRNLQPFWLQLLEKRIFYGSGAFADEAPQRDLASYEGVVITQIPESGAATPCHSSPNKDDAADTCGNEANGFAVSDMSTSEEGSSNSRKRCIHGTRLLKNDFKQRTLEKTNEGAENQNGVGRGGGKKRRKCSSECSMERTDEVAREKCIKLCDDGSLYEHDTDSARGGCGDGAVDSRMDIQKKVIPEYSLSGNSRMRNLTDNIESMDVRWVNDISTKIVHNVRMPKKDCDKVQNNSNDGIVDSSDESLAFGSIEKSSNIQIATSEVQNLHHNTASGSAALIPETAGSCVSVVPSCQVVFVPVLSNVNWLVLTHPPSQAIVGTQLVQPLQVGDTTQDSADALSVGNSSDFVVSAKGAESVAGTDQTHGLSTGTSTLKSSDHELAHETFVHTACVRGRVVPSGNMQDASLEERSCALSVVADADLVQTANISRSENSAAEKNFLANDHKSRSAGSVTKCSSSHGSEVLRLGQDRIMAMLDSGFADTNPKMVTENAQKLPTTENLIEDMPDVDNYEVVKKSGSSDADIVTLREGAVESSKPSGLNDIVDPAEGCSSPPTPEESSSSGLTLLFSGQDDSTRNIREEMSPPHTPCWHHSPGIIDDSASKTRFTDIDGSQAEWRRDEWRPRTPGQPVRPDDRGKRNCTKTKRSLLMNFENMASQRPATVDCGVQWEPVDVSSNHESSSSSNTSLYDVSVEDRLSGSVTQEENEGIIRESLEVKETEGDREGGQPNEEPKCKKRKRKERLRDGLKGMLNGEHRARQMRALSHVILGDFKQKMFMHQHKIQAIQQLITSGPPSTQMFQKLREILGDEHDLLLILVSFLFPEDLISESVLNDPIRKAYASAIEMILNIEAYATFGRSKFSARSIFRYIRELGPFCTSEELQARLYDVVGTEDPLWSALSTYLPTAPHPQMHQQYEYEHVDTASWDVASAEWEDVDMSYILKADTERRRKPAIIANGKLLVEKKGRLCEAIACFKCEEAVTIDGTEGDDCAVTSAEKFGNEFRADASEVEVVVERDYEENSFNATAGNQTLVKSCLGEMTATRKILSMESITDEDAEASEKLVDGENVTEKETKILAVDVEPVVKRGMDSPDRTLCMDLRSPGNEEVDGGIVGRDTFGKNFDKKLLGQRMSNEKTAGKVLSKWRTEENLTVKNGKQETLMEKWLKSKDADSICEGLDGVGWQSGGVLVDVEESIRSKKKALKCIDTQMSATSSNLGASFSEALKRGFEAKAASGLNNEVALCEQNPEKLCFVPGKTDVGAMEKGRSSNGERNKAISSKNNEKGEVVSKLRRSAENMDNSIFTADVRKKEKGEGDSKSASNALHGTGEREWVEGAQASYNIKYRNKERFFVQEARDERDRCTEHRKRRSEPGLAITSRADELYSRNSFREQAEPSVRHCEREPNVHWRSMNGVGHRESHFEVREPFGKKEYPDVTGDLRRREVIDDKGTFHRREHPEIERRPHRRQFDNRFGQSHRERNEEQLKRETTSRDEYTYICERDSLGREVWKKSWKRKTEDVVHHRWVSGTLRTDNTRFSHERSYDEVGRNSLGDGHKVSGDSRADRVVSRFGRREVPHQGRRHLDNWLREDSQRIDKNMRFIAEGRPYPDRSYKRAESRETSRQRSKSVRSVRTHFDVREEHPRTPSSDIRGKKYNFQELKKRVRHRNRCCDDTEVSMKRVRTPSMSTTGDHREPYSEERTLHTKVSRGVELEPGEVVSDESNDCTEVALHVMQRRTKDRQHNRVEAGSSSSKEAHVEYFGQRGQGEVPAVCSQDAIRSGLSPHKARGMEGESDESETVNERSEVFSSSKKDSEKRPSSTLSHKLSEMPKKLKAAWSREEDEELLHTYNQFDGDVEKVVCVLARTIHLRDLAEIKERLLFLLSLF